MARFTLIADQATTLRIIATGCDALRLTVTGYARRVMVPLLDTYVDGDGRSVIDLSHEFRAGTLENFEQLHVDPVLYGRADQSYRLEIGLRAPDSTSALLEVTSGILARSRVSTLRRASGSDAPLLVVDLDAPRRALAATRAAPRPAAPESAPRDDLDTSFDFPLGSSPGAAAADDGAKLYPVWYGTNRMPTIANGKLVGYSPQRDKEVHYGRCTVRVPRSHKIGQTGSMFWKRLLTLTDDRLTLDEVKQLERPLFWAGVAEQLRAADVGQRHVVVFLHGYNVSFEDAAIRAAQLGFDLSIEGAMAFYSWPSRGTVEGYFADESTVQASGKHVTRFLQEISELADAENVHVIAHSMGNRAALEAVREIVARAQERAGIPFSQFILAAPDVDAEYFLQFAELYRSIAARTTMYVSDRDFAVNLSRFLHGGEPRVGLSPPLQIVAGIDTVYAGKVDQSLLGHGYVATAWQLLNDMHQMIHLDAAPNQRSWVRRASTGDHWLLEGVA